MGAPKGPARDARGAIAALRSVETIFVPHPQFGRALVLRDTEGLTAAQATIPGPLVPIVARFDGTRTAAQIAKDVSAQLGETVPEALVEQIAAELDAQYFLDNPRARQRREQVTEEFRQAPTRPAAHAGGAYPGERDELKAFLTDTCFDGNAPAAARAKPQDAGGDLIALVAPHIDPYRGALGYGRAYSALAAALPDAVDTFVLLGTCHAPMEHPFALTRKAFATPLGEIACDEKAVSFLAKRAPFDAFGSELCHKREHSLEFQAVMLKHLLSKRGDKAAVRARIVPVLAGLGDEQGSGREPDQAAFFDALGELAHTRRGRLVFIVGADLAHVGPRFGDRMPLDAAGRAALAQTDAISLDRAVKQDARGFWEHVQGDLEQRRVCGLAPIYTLLRSLTRSAEGRVLHYEQNVDPDEGSVVSFAALGFYASSP